MGNSPIWLFNAQENDDDDDDDDDDDESWDLDGFGGFKTRTISRAVCPKM